LLNLYLQEVRSTSGQCGLKASTGVIHLLPSTTINPDSGHRPPGGPTIHIGTGQQQGQAIGCTGHGIGPMIDPPCRPQRGSYPSRLDDSLSFDIFLPP
jgi:hypothetical protein